MTKTERNRAGETSQGGSPTGTMQHHVQRDVIGELWQSSPRQLVTG